MDNSQRNAQNVLEMTDYRPGPGYSELAQVEAYWDALRGQRLTPKRSEIDPRGIETALEYAFIVERIAIGVARLRVAGSHMSDLMGMEVRGMPISTFFMAPFRRQISDTLEEVFQSPARCDLHLTSQASAGSAALEGRMILLPLQSDLGDVSRILGCFITHGSIGEAPRRFAITDSKMRPITLSGKKTAAPQAQTRTVLPANGLSETGQPFSAKPKTRKAPYLRLVKSSD